MDEFNYEHEIEMKIRLEIIEDFSRNNIPLNNHRAIDNFLLNDTYQYYSLNHYTTTSFKKLSRSGV